MSHVITRAQSASRPQPLRRLSLSILAVAVAASGGALAPAAAQAEAARPATSLSGPEARVLAPAMTLAVSSVGKDVTLVPSLTNVLGSTLLGDSVVTFTSVADRTKSWSYQLPAAKASDLTKAFTLDTLRPTATLPARGDAGRLPDGTYVVTTTTQLLGGLLGNLLTLTSDAVTTTLRAFTTPGAPTGLLASVPTNGASTVSWLPPSSDGGSAVLEYVVTAIDAQGGVVDTCRTTTTSCDLTALTSAVVGVLVVAVNGLGESVPATALLSLPGGGSGGGSGGGTGGGTGGGGTGGGGTGGGSSTPIAPAAPSGVIATPGNAAATVRWAAASSAGLPVTGYTVTAAPGGASCSTSGALTCEVPGLANGTSYTFTVVAQALVLSSVASAPSAPVTPSTVPGVPAWATTTSSYDAATLGWRAPSVTGGSPVTGYRVTLAGRTFTTRATSLRVTGLTARTAYVATVRALNARGAGAATSAKVVTAQAPRLTASITPKAKRSGTRAALVKVDLSRASTVVVRLVRGSTAASRTVALGSAPTWVSVPVVKKSAKLLNGKPVVLQVLTTGGAKVASVRGTVRR